MVHGGCRGEECDKEVQKLLEHDHDCLLIAGLRFACNYFYTRPFRLRGPQIATDRRMARFIIRRSFMDQRYFQHQKRDSQTA